MTTAIIDHWKHLLSFSLFGFIVAFLLAIQSGDIMYDSALLMSVLWKW